MHFHCGSASQGLSSNELASARHLLLRDQTRFDSTRLTFLRLTWVSPKVLMRPNRTWIQTFISHRVQQPLVLHFLEVNIRQGKRTLLKRLRG